MSHFGDEHRLRHETPVRDDRVGRWLSVSWDSGLVVQYGHHDRRCAGTAKSTRTLAAELTARGHRVSADTVGDLLRVEGFSLQGNAKTHRRCPAPGPGRAVPLHQRAGPAARALATR